MEEIDKIVEEELSSAKERILTSNGRFENFDSSNFIHLINVSFQVEEELNLAKEQIKKRITRPDRDGNPDSPVKQMKLQFRNKICPEILTGEEIKGEGNAFMELALVDRSTGNVIEAGPEASASADIVLLKGKPDATEGDDWTAEEFEKDIIKDEEGKKPLLAGNVPLKLQRGIGVMKTVKFRHRASEMMPAVFQLGAKVDAVHRHQVKEAKTEPFTVKVYRNKYYRKHKVPSLMDEVFRLVNIGKGGKIVKRLQAKEIDTVEDFLIRLLIDPEGLKRIAKMGSTKKWRDTIDNARACSKDERVYCYTDFKRNRGIVFNVLGQVLRLYLNNQFVPTEIHEAEAQELLASAYKNWGAVKPFNDTNSPQEYLSRLSINCGLLDSQLPDYPSCGHVDAETSERIGESASSRYHHSLQSFSDFGSFHTSNFEIGDDAHIPHSPWPHFGLEATCFPDNHNFIFQTEMGQMAVSGHMNEPNVGEQIVDEPEVVCNKQLPKRWKMLLCVSRLFWVRKKIGRGLIN